MAEWTLTTTDEEIDAALEQARSEPPETTIVEAAYDPKLKILMLRLSDDRRLFIPKEHLGELKNATPAQATDLRIGLHGVSIWWQQLDDGLYLPDFLQYRWRKEFQVAAGPQEMLAA